MLKIFFFFFIIFGKECIGNKFILFKINSVVYKVEYKFWYKKYICINFIIRFIGMFNFLEI